MQCLMRCLVLMRTAHSITDDSSKNSLTIGQRPLAKRHPPDDWRVHFVRASTPRETWYWWLSHTHTQTHIHIRTVQDKSSLRTKLMPTRHGRETCDWNDLIFSLCRHRLIYFMSLHYTSCHYQQSESMMHTSCPPPTECVYLPAAVVSGSAARTFIPRGTVQGCPPPPLSPQAPPYCV